MSAGRRSITLTLAAALGLAGPVAAHAAAVDDFLKAGGRLPLIGDGSVKLVGQGGKQRGLGDGEGEPAAGGGEAMRITVLLGMSFALAFAPVSAPAASDMQPGLWEVTVRIEMPGAPMAMPPQTARHCYTRKDLEDGRNAVPADDTNCQIRNYQLRGNTASWTMECTGAGAMTGAGTMTVGATSYSGSIKSRMKEGGETVEMTQSWVGRRVGDCQ